MSLVRVDRSCPVPQGVECLVSGGIFAIVAPRARTLDRTDGSGNSRHERQHGRRTLRAAARRRIARVRRRRARRGVRVRRRVRTPHGSRVRLGRMAGHGFADVDVAGPVHAADTFRRGRARGRLDYILEHGISPTLQQLHWLLIQQHATIKVTCLLPRLPVSTRPGTGVLGTGLCSHCFIGRA